MASGRAISVFFLLALAVKGQQPFIYTPQQTAARQPFLPRQQSPVSRSIPAVGRAQAVGHQAAGHQVRRQGHFGHQHQQAAVARQQASVARQQTPVVGQQVQIARQPTPVVRQPTPVVRQPTPVVRQPTPVVRQSTPVARQLTPVVPQPHVTRRQAEPRRPKTTTEAPTTAKPTSSPSSSRSKSSSKSSSRSKSSSSRRRASDAASTSTEQCQPTAAQLSALLAPRLEVAVRRALAAHKCGDPDAMPGTQQPCDLRPAPLPRSNAPHREPAVRACAKSCLQLRDEEDPLPDGIYWLTDIPVPVYCDFTHDGGGWTLLLTAVSRDGWDLLSVLARNRRSPSLTDNYSILRYADAIKNLSNSDRFAYRIEAQADVARLRSGGVWLAPRYYSFVDETGAQTDVRLVRRFGRWDYDDLGIEQRMPWLRIQGGDTTVLTTSDRTGANWWGTLVTHKMETSTNYRHSPWMSPDALNSGTVLYWLREEEM